VKSLGPIVGRGRKEKRAELKEKKKSRGGAKRSDRVKSSWPSWGAVDGLRVASAHSQVGGGYLGLGRGRGRRQRQRQRQRQRGKGRCGSRDRVRSKIPTVLIIIIIISVNSLS
jgi:hypothetical protein